MIVDDDGHLVPIGARHVHADRFAHFSLREAADAQQRIMYDVALPPQLGVVGKMLKLTSPAGSEDRAERTRSLGRLDQQLEHLRDRVPLLDRVDANARPLAGQRSKAENDDAGRSADTLAVGQNIRKFDLEFGAGPQARSFRRCVAARQAP